MVDLVLILLVLVLVMGLVFDYINGFHDAANAVATVVSTGVLPMRTAVLLAGFLNILGAFLGTEVAKTIASGFAEATTVTQPVVLAALVGASAWNLITWYYGLPSSSSHALIGGLAGAVVAKGGLLAFNWLTLVKKVLIPLIVSPLAGFTIAFLFMIGLLWICRRARPAAVHRLSRRMQLLSSCTMAFAHGSNDAQKSMGVMTLALAAYVANGRALAPWLAPLEVESGKFSPPMWVVLSCALAIGLGTMAGGARIIKTMGAKILRISPLQGFAAETAGAMTILTASHFGAPISTTHAINACIIGVGASKRLSSVRWGVAGNMVVAWILTIPLSALMSYLCALAFIAIFE
jgi:PiT family inorganic phosphate transporter